MARPAQGAPPHPTRRAGVRLPKQPVSLLGEVSDSGREAVWSAEQQCQVLGEPSVNLCLAAAFMEPGSLALGVQHREEAPHANRCHSLRPGPGRGRARDS